MIWQWLQNMARKRSLREVGYVYGGSLINGLSLFVINIAIARTVQPEQFAVFTLSVLVLSTVAEMSDFGLNAGLLRFVPYYAATQQQDKLKQLVKTIWQWRVALTVILTAVSFIFAYPIARYLLGHPEITRHLAFASFGIGGVIMLGFVATYLQARQRFLYQALVQSLKGVVRLVIVLIMVFAGVKSVFVYLSVYLVVPWILFLLNYHVLPPQFKQVQIEPEVKQNLHSKLARFSVWLTISSLMSIIASRIDQVMVTNLLGLRQQAVYAAAYQLIQFYPLITQSIMSILMPKVSSLQNKQELIALVKRASVWIAVGFIGVGLLVYPSQYLITLFFGHRYDASMPVYLVLAYSLLLNVFSIPFSLVITVFNKTQLVAFAGVLQLGINVVFNLLLIPRYGVMGAAYTFAIGIIASIVYNAVLSWRLLKTKELVVL